MALKGEALGLAGIVELPMVLVDVQRGGPSTGLPTKTEQSDLNIVMWGRHGELPLPVIAAQSPSDCFDAAIEAVRVALKYMMPVVLMTDGYIANGAEPWRLPEMDKIPAVEAKLRTEVDGFAPYIRDPETLARPWAIPGTPGLEHRVGGLEKEAITGNVSYDPQNHEDMCKTRADKVARVLADVPDVAPHGDDNGTLVVSWGGTFGAVRTAVDTARKGGLASAHVHLRWLNPLPANLGDVMKQYDRVMVCELNAGQLWRYLRAEYLVDAVSYTKIQGKPFKVSELVARMQTLAG